MKDEAQRIAIAEACEGWKVTVWDGYAFQILHPDGRGCGSAGNMAGIAMDKAGVPDYLNDLNAMHEAEKVLTQDRQWDTYAAFLGDLTGGRQIDLGALRINATTKIISATAAQRAEAFLRTLGLWTP